MIEVNKKEKETSISLIRRFTRRVQQSGILFRARAGRFKTRPKSKLKKKMEAIKMAGRQKRMNYLRKLGKLE